jgi:hypothetical protein
VVEKVIPKKIMEEYIMDAFKTALKISVTDKMLPMESRTLLEKHMNLCTPEGIVLDFKNTSWKKINTFLRKQ